MRNLIPDSIDSAISKINKGISVIKQVRHSLPHKNHHSQYTKLFKAFLS